MVFVLYQICSQKSVIFLRKMNQKILLKRKSNKTRYFTALHSSIRINKVSKMNSCLT